MINPQHKNPLYELIDKLPEEEIHTARRFLEFLIIRTPKEIEEDSDYLTPGEMMDSEEGWQEIMRGEGIPWEKARKELADG